jgi:hypothetical protein
MRLKLSRLRMKRQTTYALCDPFLFFFFGLPLIICSFTILAFTASSRWVILPRPSSIFSS